MAPIGNHDSHKLQVTTNVGGKLYENEEVTQVYYHGHKSVKPPIPPAAMMGVFGSNQGQPEAPEPVKPFAKAKPQQRKRKPKAGPAPDFEIEPKMQEALEKDLTSRGIKSRKTDKTT